MLCCVVLCCVVLCCVVLCCVVLCCVVLCCVVLCCVVRNVHCLIILWTWWTCSWRLDIVCCRITQQSLRVKDLRHQPHPVYLTMSEWSTYHNTSYSRVFLRGNNNNIINYKHLLCAMYPSKILVQRHYNRKICHSKFKNITIKLTYITLANKNPIT